MRGTLEYKGYIGSVEYSDEDGLLFGKLVGIRDKVLYDAPDVKTLRKHFENAIDEYLKFCKAEGKTPDKPFKGSLNIRISPELHRNLAMKAEREHKSLNAVISDVLSASTKPAA